MDKGKQLSLSIKARERVKIRIGGREIEFESNTPQATFWNHLFYELTRETPGATLLPLTRICLIDTGGGTNGCSSLSSTDFSVSANTVSLSKTVTTETSNPVDRIALYGGSEYVLYFVTPLPSTISVPAGTPVGVTWQCTFNPGTITTGGILSGTSCSLTGLLNSIPLILAQQRGNIVLTIMYIKWFDYYGNTLKDVSASRDPNEWRVYHGAVNPDAAGPFGGLGLDAVFGTTRTRIVNYTLPYPGTYIRTTDILITNIRFST